jgi:hypothetical protein
MDRGYKYRIVAWLAEITPKARQIEAKEKAMLLTGLSLTSFNRKMYSKLDQPEKAFCFKQKDLLVIKDILNEYRGPGLPKIKQEHLVNPAIEQQPAA